MTDANRTIRPPSESDYATLIGQVDAWWGGREMRHLLPRLFFQHFQPTSFAVAGDHGDGPIAFLIGFVSQTDRTVGYIHFVGVHPDHRREGLARMLYQRFFAVAGELGVRRVVAITAPVNGTSLAFHRAMGFSLRPGPVTAEGVPFQPDYDGPGDDRVVLERALDN